MGSADFAAEISGTVVPVHVSGLCHVYDIGCIAVKAVEISAFLFK